MNKKELFEEIRKLSANMGEVYKKIGDSKNKIGPLVKEINSRISHLTDAEKIELLVTDIALRTEYMGQGNSTANKITQSISKHLDLGVANLDANLMKIASDIKSKDAEILSLKKDISSMQDRICTHIRETKSNENELDKMKSELESHRESGECLNYFLRVLLKDFSTNTRFNVSEEWMEKDENTREIYYKMDREDDEYVFSIVINNNSEEEILCTDEKFEAYLMNKLRSKENEQK